MRLAVFALFTASLCACVDDAPPAAAAVARAAEVHGAPAVRAPSAVRTRVSARIDDARARHTATIERMNRIDARRAGVTPPRAQDER